MGNLIAFDKKILDLCGTLELLLGFTGMFKDPPLTLNGLFQETGLTFWITVVPPPSHWAYSIPVLLSLITTVMLTQ